MDIQQKSRPYLEPIQEESEQEDEMGGSQAGEGEEDFQIQVGVETEEVMAEDESEDDDDDAVLRVRRPRRLSPSLSQKRFLQMQSTANHQEEVDTSSVPDPSTQAVDLSGEATTSRQPKLWNKKLFSGWALKVKVSKIRRQKRKTPKPSAQRRTKKKNRKGSSLPEEQFPQWLVDLMVNIEEATTHQLVVE